MELRRWLAGAWILGLLVEAAGCNSTSSTQSTSNGVAGAAGNGSKVPQVTAGAVGKGSPVGLGAAGSAGEGEAGAPAKSDGTCIAVGDCPVISTRPEGCAETACVAGKCVYRGADKDGDGFLAKRCQSLASGIAVEPGLDCDDADPKVNPNAWDGPAGNGEASACNDGLDNDCSGTIDDASLDDGTTCMCKPLQLQPCAFTASGVAITYPVLDPKGAPVGTCKLGSQTCLPNGTWGECTGAVGPTKETCDGQDNNCDGIASDVDPTTEKTTWSCDADSDNHLPIANPITQSACTPPSSGCTGQWLAKNATAKSDDCNDSDPLIFPGATERCNRLDDNCDKDGGAEPDEDTDGDGFTATSYTGCTGGFPKTDCYDLNADVHPNQATYFDRPFCRGYFLCQFPEGGWYCSCAADSCPTIGRGCTPSSGGDWDYDCSSTVEHFDAGALQATQCVNDKCSLIGSQFPKAGDCGTTQATLNCNKNGNYMCVAVEIPNLDPMVVKCR